MDGQVPTLAAVLAEVPDPRGARGRRRPWSALLPVIVAGLPSGAHSQRALARWGRDVGRRRRRRLGFTRRRSPSLATVHRALHRVDVPAPEARVGWRLQRVRAARLQSAVRWLEGAAIDGKTLRGARRLRAEDAYLLSAYGQRDGPVLGEVAGPDATNELGGVEARALPWPSARQVLRLRRRRIGRATGALLSDEAAFAEDAATTRTDHAPRALAALRNLALALLHRWRGRDITAARQFFAGHTATLSRRRGLAPRRL